MSKNLVKQLGASSVHVKVGPFIKYNHPEIDLMQLCKYLSIAPKRMTLFNTKEQKNLIHAYFVFDKEKEARKCAVKFNGFPFKGYKLKAEMFTNSFSRISSVPSDNTNSLKVRGFPLDIKVEDIDKFLGEKLCNYVFSFRVYRNNQGFHTGMAWVDFLNVEDAVKAKNSLENDASLDYPLMVSYGRAWTNPNLFYNNYIDRIHEVDED